ncbi:MAG: hypothetical protein JAZ02_08170 [Candidatus Thiodiazotropha endolucinida]|nr:hypothetical protein [Candidatus Thiodiazotropha endolucinida]
MKLIIREYLSSLKERDELDAILPDLLSQLGLNVYSRPTRGTRQDGVDVGAVGSLDGGPDKVYLFSIKPGDLTRRGWDGESEQSLRPSLNEIVDAYIPNRMPAEHRDKEIVVCITIGGDVQEQVRPLLTGYIAQNTKTNIRFEEWNGDKIASYIQSSFLREDLLPAQARSLLRKSLAMLDEPEVSYRHFASLIRALAEVEHLNDPRRVTAIRQMSICLWILFAWAREAENMESAYLASEFTLLHAWTVVRLYTGQRNKTARAVETAFVSIFSAYRDICSEFLGKNVLPYADKLHALSVAVHSSCSLDVNLKLFDLLGRLGTAGIWAYWGALRCPEEEETLKEATLRETATYVESIKALILNNPALVLPIKDGQAIDVFIAASLLATDRDNCNFITDWLSEMLERAGFSYKVNGKYPCALEAYGDLLVHPKSSEADYRSNATSASILYPSIALWAALLNDDATYTAVAILKQNQLQHCTFQFWYPDDRSEAHFYANTENHGATLANLAIDEPKETFLSQVFGECTHLPYFKELSAVKFGWWPLILIACRHYRLPLPLHIVEGLHNPNDDGKPEQEITSN